MRSSDEWRHGVMAYWTGVDGIVAESDDRELSTLDSCLDSQD